MSQRKSRPYTDLDRLFPLLSREEQVCVLWDYLRELKLIEEFAAVSHHVNVVLAENLIEQLSEEEFTSFVDKHESVMTRPVHEAARKLIWSEDRSFPERVLLACLLTPETKIRSRSLSAYFADLGISASNMSATLDQLEKQELIEVGPEQEGREKEFTLSRAGIEKLKRLLKRELSNPSEYGGCQTSVDVWQAD